MIYVTQSEMSPPALVEQRPRGGLSSTGQAIEKYRGLALAHFYEPATRQLTLVPHFSVAEAEEGLELDSPQFTPPELEQFAQRGFVRKNRWRTKGPAESG